MLIAYFFLLWDIDVAIDWNNLGSAWDSLGKYKKAVSYFEKALKIRETFLGKNHPYTKDTKEFLELARDKL